MSVFQNVPGVIFSTVGSEYKEDRFIGGSTFMYNGQTKGVRDIYIKPGMAFFYRSNSKKLSFKYIGHVIDVQTIRVRTIQKPALYKLSIQPLDRDIEIHKNIEDRYTHDSVRKFLGFKNVKERPQGIMLRK